MIRRIEYLDIAKGIGIILVVFSHTTNSGELLRTIVFGFHMPLFFFIGASFFNERKKISEICCKEN